MEGLVFQYLTREQQKSEYDWVSIQFEGCCVGKARCLIAGDEFTVFTINIYPEFQGNGYGTAFVESVKNNYSQTVANRVRSTAIRFWEKEGFSRDGETENWVFTKSGQIFKIDKNCGDID